MEPFQIMRCFLAKYNIVLMQLTRALTLRALYLEQFEMESDCSLTIASHFLIYYFFPSSNVTVDLDVVREIGEDHISE